MREYEIIFIIHPDLDENATSDAVEKITSWITDAGGAIIKSEPWGKRQLAYPIRKQNEGQYFYLQTEMAPSFVSTMEQDLRFLEPVMRFLITSVK